MFTLFTGPCWRTKTVLQHGGPTLGSVILCGKFRRISQLWDEAHTLNLENCFLYLLSTISQFFDFVRCIVFDFIFYCVTAHTLYLISINAFFLLLSYDLQTLKLAITERLSLIRNFHVVFWDRSDFGTATL